MKLQSLSAAVVMLLVGTSWEGAGTPARVKAPGYRPDCKQARAFLENVAASRVAVMPTIVRTHQGAVYSQSSRKAAVDFLKEKNLGTPETRSVALNSGRPKGKYQYEVIRSGLKEIGRAVMKTMVGARMERSDPFDMD